MENLQKQNQKMDVHTKQYIRRIKYLQIIVFVIMSIFFLIFAQRVVSDNSESLKAVAIAEVQESMQETVNNICIHIDVIRDRLTKEVDVLITDTMDNLENRAVTSVEEILAQMSVCKENAIGNILEAVYETDSGERYHLKVADATVVRITETEEKYFYHNTINKTFELNGNELILFIRQTNIDELAKEEIYTHIHSEYYEGNQYVWVNEVVNIAGGDNYAIRRIHPNLRESEGEYLSTLMQDVKGNYPYLTELEGIREEGKIWQSYYFKNKTNDEITEKFSYSQYYAPFKWIVSTGETLEEAYAYSQKLSEHNLKQVILLMTVFMGLLALVFMIIIKILGKQAHGYRERLMKQSEVLEDIFQTMSAGMVRIRVTDTESSVITINPKGLELFGVESEEEFIMCRKNHVVNTADESDIGNMKATYEKLNDLWDSVVVECRIKWKDDSVHLLRVRNTLVGFDGDAKIIQRMLQDITEERSQQEEALRQAEEKATLDPMTQIKNKRAIEMITRERIKEAASKRISVAVGFVDIDNFRDYNTKYGHLQGDEVIKYVAKVLKESVKGDVGRTGGDEFTFCMLNPSYQDVENAMKEMHRRLNDGIAIMGSGEIIPTPCSIGVVITQGMNLEYDSVLKASDEAMYCAKEKGKNTYYILEEKKEDK